MIFRVFMWLSRLDAYYSEVYKGMFSVSVLSRSSLYIFFIYQLLGFHIQVLHLCTFLSESRISSILDKSISFVPPQFSLHIAEHNSCSATEGKRKQCRRKRTVQPPVWYHLSVPEQLTKYRSASSSYPPRVATSSAPHRSCRTANLHFPLAGHFPYHIPVGACYAHTENMIHITYTHRRLAFSSHFFRFILEFNDIHRINMLTISSSARKGESVRDSPANCQSNSFCERRVSQLS